MSSARLVLLSLMACACGSHPVTVRFAGVVGDAPFDCTQHYALGTPATDVKPRDFRLYVHDVALLDAKGTAHPLTLDTTAWQRGRVALLDFEDGTGTCSNGTSGTNSNVSGTVDGAYTGGVRFTFGLPFELDHADATAAAPPLDSSAMFWSWEAGYKFLRLEGISAGLPQGFNVHVGSTGCMSGATPGVVTGCTANNTVEVTLTPFDPTSDVVAVDVAALLAGSDLSRNQTDTPVLCMSSDGDGDCAPIFSRLGLPWAGAPASSQQLFRRK